ncbi:Dbl homology domain-containing protein [Absidia repens]|uniref:Dbl homology domain-containing protein n=1 Tax=Absidia repens TaxID=90262 RepID=A0A1X2I3E2_9FUNG|nr:Dbl homology domain-containing protein [Absidia repens]
MSQYNQYQYEQTSSFGTSTQSTRSSESYPSDYASFVNDPLPPIPNQLANTKFSQPGTANIHDFSDDALAMINDLNYDDVDDGLIEHEIDHRKREAFVNQLITSEQAYIQSLELVVNVFLKPLKKDSKQTSFNFLGSRKLVCTEREIKWLFGNFETIVQIHRTILTSLEQRLRIWGPAQIISDVFQSWFPLLEVYHGYLSNYDVAMTTYERLTKYQPFKKFIDNAHKDRTLKGATLLSLLQIPAGCTHRYEKLICGIADTTNMTHPDYSGVQQCKQQIIGLASSILPRVTDADNVDQVLMIQQALVGAPFGVKAQRRLILQGQLARVVINSKSMGEERTYILFSDILVFVRPKQEGKKTTLQYKGHIGLEQARVRAIPNQDAAGQEYCIEIVSSFQGVDNLNSTFMGATSTHVLHTHSLEEQQTWIRKLDRVIAKLDRDATRNKAEANKRRNDSRTPPQSLHRTGTSSKLSVTSSQSQSTSGSERQTL